LTDSVKCHVKLIKWRHVTIWIKKYKKINLFKTKNQKTKKKKKKKKIKGVAAHHPVRPPLWFYFYFLFLNNNKFIYLFFNKFIFFLFRWTRVAILLFDVVLNRIWLQRLICNYCLLREPPMNFLNHMEWKIIITNHVD